MTAELLAHGGSLVQADPSVILGYPSGRGRSEELVLGPGAHLRSGTVLYAGSRIGAGFQTGHNVVVREEVVIGDDVSLWSGTVVDYGTTIGDRVKVHTSCYVAQYSELADDVFLAPGVIFANDLYPGSDLSAQRMLGPVLEAGVQIGCNCTVLPFVRIGAGTVVGAGSVVTRDLPAGVVAYGNPARPVKAVGELQDIAQRTAEGDVRSRLERRTGAAPERRPVLRTAR
jgi:acetyltransferase-like isoleucine patch superfamily enzyme